MYGLKQELISKISDINPLHAKYLSKFINTLDDDENIALENLINHFINKGDDMDFLADAYMLFVTDSIKEQKYFFAEGRYRHSSFEEVNKLIYDNPEYMNKYMIGVALSHYLWMSHLEISRYFKSFINRYKYPGGKYLEVGPGYGEYFLIAMNNSDMSCYEGIDISETSVKGAKEFISTRTYAKNYDIHLMDFLKYNSDTKRDIIVTTEVLEHVETPAVFISKIKELLSPAGTAFVSTVINAPTLDHIYLFKNKEEVFELVNSCGLNIRDSICVTSNGKPLSSAERMGEPILIALILSL